MPFRDLLLLLLICLIWAGNNIVSKLVIAHMGVPPFAFATVRFVIVAAAVSPWLRNMPGPQGRLIVASLLMGAANFGFLFLGFRTASPSGIAIVNQLTVPTTTLLSVWLLGERIHWRRILGIALTLAGALLVMWNPRALNLSTGLLYSAASALCFSVGAVMIKQMSSVKPLQFQAWLAALAIPPMLLFSVISEHGQVAAVLAGGWAFVGGVLFSALASSVIAYTGYFWLLQRHETNVVAPLTLMIPIFTIVLGVAITDDPFDIRVALGAVVTMIGVLIVLLRPRTLALKMALVKGRAT